MGTMKRPSFHQIIFAVCLILVLTWLPMPQSSAAEPCYGRFPNPFTDVCWKCVFPISIGPLRIDMGMEDSGDSVPLICTCPAPPPVFVRIGFGAGFWEPARVAEVVRTPFCSPLLGGVTLGSLAAPSGTNVKTSDRRDAFYHVHWYIYPLLAWMNLLTDLACVTPESFDVLYITEVDPLWEDDELAFLINPEAALFANPVAQAACAADCAAATLGFPLDPLFWCAGSSSPGTHPASAPCACPYRCPSCASPSTRRRCSIPSPSRSTHSPSAASPYPGAPGVSFRYAVRTGLI